MSAPTQAAPPPLFRLTGGADFPSHAKVLLTGPPKSGKTSFLGTVPNIVIADTEPHANNLQSIAHKNLPYVTVNGSPDLQRLLFVLSDDSLRAQAAQQLGLPKIEAVSIDTMDTLQQILKRERMKEQRTTKFQRDDWAWLKDEMVGIVNAFTKLPLHVIFTVHIKTQTIGPEDSQSTVFLPALQGAIDQEIAGMVGYSFLTFRREEVRADGTPYTRYLLRAEGNDTYSFLGNRNAGRLPDVVEPTFQAVLDAIKAGQAAITTPAQQPQFTVVGGGQPAVQQAALPPAPAPAPAAPAAAPAPAPAAQPTAPATQEVAQSPGQPAQPETAQQAPVQTAVQTPEAATQHATPAGQPTDAKPDDGEPATPAALNFAKRVYDACTLEFPEATIQALTLGQVRQLVKMWQAIQSDAVEGKLDGKNPVDEMAQYLLAMGWLSAKDAQRIEGGGAATTPAPAGPVADISGTVEQVMAYVGDDLAKAQEAYDLEMAKTKPRVSLVNALEARGVQVQTPVQSAPPQAPVEQPAAAPQEPSVPAETPVTPVTQQAPPADVPQGTDPQEAAAVALVQNELGGVPINEDGSAKGCEECGGPIDDEDIATLSQSRFNRRLCVSDYIAETKKPH